MQHRTRFLERKVALPPAPPAERQLPVAKQRHGFRWIALVSGIFPLLGIGVGVFFMVQQVGGIDKVGDALSDVKDSITGDRWVYGGKGSALFHDVNNDGKLDLITPIRYVQKNDSYNLAAFDGSSGSMLWESESFGNHDDAVNGLTILHGGAITQTDNRGNIAGYAVATGERLWKIPVSEKVKEVCAGDDVSLALQLNDKSWRRILVKDGDISRLDRQPGNCERIATGNKFGQTDLAYASQNRRNRRPRTKLAGMEVRDLVTLTNEAGNQVALGNKSPGTRIPMLAYLGAAASKSEASGGSRVPRRTSREAPKTSHDAPKTSHDAPKTSHGAPKTSHGAPKTSHGGSSNSKRTAKGTMLWSSELPARDPLATKEGPPELVAVSKSHIASLYKLKNGQTHVVCFTREGGKRLWDVRLSEDSFPIISIDIANDMVYVGQWGSLNAFKIADGSRAFRLGR